MLGARTASSASGRKSRCSRVDYSRFALNAGEGVRVPSKKLFVKAQKEPSPDKSKTSTRASDID
jgi:hypothetical protein